MNEALKAVEPFNHKIRVVRNDTITAAEYVREAVDFVYVDARHDYCGVSNRAMTHNSAQVVVFKRMYRCTINRSWTT